MIAIVTGGIASWPVGGVVWDYGQYALGLEQLGLDVYYLEDTGRWAYDPAEETYTADGVSQVKFLEASLRAISPRLGERWHYRAADGRTYGIGADAMEQLVADADLFVNVSGLCLLRDAYMPCRRKILIDTDPGVNHFVEYPRWDTKTVPAGINHIRDHDHFFTYAECLGRPGCRLPDLGIPWHPTRPPVVLEAWTTGRADGRWTTVMNWKMSKTVAHDGIVYGAKGMQFDAVETLPVETGTAFELAVSRLPAQRGERLRQLGWSVADALQISRTAESYRQYVQDSHGEFSVAKNVYVATGSGWFSCRSVCYLASGRPVVLEDTGFSALVPTGDGLLAFSGLREASDAIARVDGDYDHHAGAAREVAAAHFDAHSVLADLLDRAGMSGL